MKKTSIFREYACSVEKFHVDPRFECYKKCPIVTDYVLESRDSFKRTMDADDAFEIMAELEGYDIESEEDLSDEQFSSLLESIFYWKNRDGDGDDGHKDKPDCDVLERDTLDWYSPKLCLHAKYGFEDPLCPPEAATCYTGKKWRRKCSLSCPLAYNVTVHLNVDHIGTVQKNRDLGTDKDRYISYKDTYTPGAKLSCQVVKGSGGDHDVLFIDERISHEAMQWWKWSLFSGSILLVLLTTTGSVISYVRYRERVSRGLDGDGEQTGFVYAPIGTDTPARGSNGSSGSNIIE